MKVFNDWGKVVIKNFCYRFQEEWKFNVNIRGEIPGRFLKWTLPAGKNVCSKSIIETPEQTVKFAQGL